MTNNHPKIGLGVFTKSSELEQAINQLKAADFPVEQISVIAKDVEKRDAVGDVKVSDRIGKQDVNTTGAIGDTLTATTWGGLLVGISSLALPGTLGAILAAGSIGAALIASIGGVAVGTAAYENLVKALVSLGIPENRARVYSDRLQQSYYLLILNGTDSEIHRVEDSLRQHSIQNWDIYDLPQQNNLKIGATG
ncbi:general stress protein [Anabaena sp. CA = ATCC 33047]|uniref:general stress protein n=1 Tax=Anabaena sp. (strain CA / ATCC 33047) TaxID=52271 RepID=UPI00083436AA|nr:general stress protein [Anabaena sp. CA = ATCC 33047]